MSGRGICGNSRRMCMFNSRLHTTAVLFWQVFATTIGACRSN